MFFLIFRMLFTVSEDCYDVLLVFGSYCLDDELIECSSPAIISDSSFLLKLSDEEDSREVGCD